MKRRTLSTLVSHPIGLVIVLGTLIGVTELLIMFAHDIFVPAIATETAWDYIDATLLIAILSPAFYLLVFRKLQTDLTERKQAQYALQESARQTQAILDNAIDGIITIDSRGTVDSFNRSAERIFGYPADEVIGQNVSILMPEPHRSEHDRFLENYLTTGEAHVIGIGRELTGRRKDGTTFPLELGISEISRDGHRMFVGIMRDVTARKQIEEAQRKYHTILKTTKDGFWIVGKDGRLLEVNDAYCRMSGYSRNDLLNMHITDLEAQESLQDTTRHIDKITKQGSDEFESRHRRKDGVIIDVEISAQFMATGDEIFIVFVKNITDRKRNEAKLREALEDAEAASRAKSTFLSVMSHELRTPLNAILGFGQLLEFDDGSSIAEQRQTVEQILSAGHQLLGLVNDILDLSRVDIGELTLNIQAVCIADLVSTCVQQTMVSLARQRNVSIENTITDNRFAVQGDAQRIQQVLINLLSNAVKYNKDNGQVTISSVAQKEGWLRIRVQDTGNGITGDNLSLLFKPFERINQTHGTISGAGIGLYVTKRLVEAMHGTVGVESAPGIGSTFWFDLPLAKQPAEPTAALGKTGLPPAHDECQFKVLYIEDNPSNVLLVERALRRRFGIELLTAGAAEEGLTVAEKELPDLILMDMRLPGMDGITATTRLKATDATKHIPVVALSADAARNDIDRALSSGCSAYLTKPFELQALYEVIDRTRSAGRIAFGAGFFGEPP